MDLERTLALRFSSHKTFSVADTINRDRFRRRLTVILLTLLCIHIVCAIFFLLVPEAQMKKKMRFYRALTHIGAVFQSASLVSSFHVIVGVHHADDTNEVIDLTNRFQNDYYSQPWKVQHLFKKFYIRNVTSSLGINLSRGVTSSDTLQLQLRQVARFLEHEIPLEEGDSVWCGFIWKKYSIEDSAYTADTVFYQPVPTEHD
jgi:hypothetical protein